MSVSYFGDAGSMFSKKREINTKEIKEWGHEARKSKNGLYLRGNERFLKLSLLYNIKDKDDCIVLGSSRTMMLSSYFSKTNPGCRSLLNLSFSGAGVEDISILSLILLTILKIHNKKVFIGIDPWSLRRNADRRYEVFKTQFYAAEQHFLSKKNKKSSYKIQSNGYSSLKNKIKI